MSEGIKSSHRRDCVLLKCVTANTDWEVVKSIGNINMELFENTYSMNFNGTNETINCGNDSSLNFERTDAFSLSVWIKTTSVSGSLFAGKMKAFPEYEGYDMYMANGRPVFYIISNWSVNPKNGIGVMTATKIVNDDEYYNIILTYDGSSNASGVKIYVDGVSQALAAFIADDLTASIQTTENFTIGARSNDGSPSLFTNGLKDEGSVWNKELTQSDVDEIFSSGKPTNLNTHSSKANLVSWWRLGEEATWDGSNWAFPDQKGSNDGISVNMGEGDRSTDVPN